MNEERFHCCATCIHFRVDKKPGSITYFCERLGYETKPDYRFNCWKPKEHVKKLMDKKNRED
ncbi:hypothetical protein ACSVDE_06280 [Pseudalkalibacillus sp. Hm43]|uniref:hypothetical protein n=1 Tax=Pseudalkalibacillus sp. Hm43 TaxID=3450742 RepID=UPI003F437643